MNIYFPLKNLGHKLPGGVYYYSFSCTPKNTGIMGGLLCSGHLMKIKVKKINGYVNFFANEYLKEII